MQITMTVVGWVKGIEVKEKFIQVRMSASSGKDATGKKEYTPVTCRVFGRSMEFVKTHITQGDKVVVTGSGRPTVWTKKDGTPPVGCLDVNVDTFTLVAKDDGTRKDTAGAPPPALGEQDIPF